MSESSALVAKLWNYCNVLRDDGVSTIEYVEQLTYLLFLKMADERAKSGLGQVVPAGLDWQSLLDRDGDDLEVHYRHLLAELGRQPGTLGTIYRKAQNRIQDPAKLRRLVVNLINEETWTAVDADLKGDAYEGLLQKGAEDTKSGAGQYFTPRPLIRAMMACLQPRPGERVADPACGTGGFLLAAHEWVVDHHIAEMDVDDKRFLRDESVHGWEIVDGTARLCAMNLLLHGIGTPIGASTVTVADALRADPGLRFEVVAANPPFGRKSSMTMVNEAGQVEREDLVIVRDDFWASTSNKQLNFLQHIKTMLKINGRAAVVLPDNVLFEAGAGETIRRRLMAECDLHTILRLPTGIFYAQGVKANVLFFDRKPAAADAWTKAVWVYDLRTNMHFTLKTKPLRESDLTDFVTAYRADDRSKRVESERFQRFTYEEIVARDKANLDITWLRDDSLDDGSTLPSPAVLAAEIVEELEAALAQFTELAATLPVIEEGHRDPGLPDPDAPGPGPSQRRGGPPSRDVKDAMADQFRLSDAERTELLPSGSQRTIDNRVSWALTYLSQAGLVARPSRGIVQITDQGQAALTTHSTRIDMRTLEDYPSYREFKERTRKDSPNPPGPATSEVSRATPSELVEQAVSANRAAVEGEVLKSALALSPTGFEDLVIRLLERMGYGKAGSVQRTSASGDAGVDGIISQDPLGLDRIYVQAKRYSEDRTIDRPRIHEFAGALLGKQGDRGVYITTSRFSSGAREEAERINARIELIDGARLAELLVEYGVGVQAQDTITLYRLDEDFFESL